MTDFFRFPRTPHLVWLGKDQPRDDKVLIPSEAQEIFAHEVHVEEKVDGANVGFSVDERGMLRAQNRGTYISRDRCHAQFKPIFRWMQPRARELAEALSPDLILFGEWCYAVHSIRYSRLPDWFLAFDVYDRSRSEFWNVSRRDALAGKLGLALVPALGAGKFNLAGLRGLLSRSQLSERPAEGLYVRSDDGGRLKTRTKLVRSEFAQAIDEHWSRRVLKANTLADGKPGEVSTWR